MEEPFKPTSLSVKELFGNTDAKYKIPKYQRPYKWEDEQVDKLWDDILDAFDNEEQNYFLGSIITAKPRDNENSVYSDVVDGQQRLTTLMILFCVIRDLYPDLNIDSKIDSAIKLPVIQHSIAEFGEYNRLKLHTHAQHASDFQNLILNGNTLELKKPYKYKIKTDEEPKYKFINTAVIFKDKLQALGKIKSEKFIDFLFNRVMIIRINCINREFAIKLFQVLNDRGMDLTAADLIKSFLLEKLYEKYKSDPDNSKINEDSFIADWRAMEQTINKTDISLNDLFIIYEYYILAQNPKKSLYDELQDVFKDKDPNILIGDIKSFANTYYDKIYSVDDKILYSFRYIRWNMYWKSILTTAHHVQYSDFTKLTKLLRRYYYLYWIAGKTLSQIKQTSFNLIKWVKENKLISEIEYELNAKIIDDKIIELAKQNLTSEQIASEAWIKPLLILMEYNVTDNSKLSFIELKSDLHLEHILPIKYEEFKEWNHITKSISAKWINSAGNLTLLSGTKNIEARNHPFKTKLSIYRGKGKYDDKNDKITAFEITQNIVKDYDNNKFNKMWNETSMIDRWKWFFNEANELLDIDFTNIITEHKPKLYDQDI